MDDQTIEQIRAVFAKIDVHPAWGLDGREAMAEAFDLYEEDLDVLNDFAMWVANHGLEYAWAAYKRERGKQ